MQRDIYRGVSTRQKLVMWWRIDHGKFNTLTIGPAIVVSILTGLMVGSH